MAKRRISETTDGVLDLDELLHPAQAFGHPSDVVGDPDLTLNEKRAILASWASDACAVDSIPALRTTPGGKTVSFDDIVDALRSLDPEQANARSRRGGFATSLRRRRWQSSGDESGGITVH